ncbi:MAG TPA: hypothetical protein VD767_09420 [Thermomicrobiales bacterium]|nr:hypothetical protein [Thermomicrobiales bacterium]
MSEQIPSSGLSEERLEILRLVESQTISAEEAGRLLEALDRSDRASRAADATAPFAVPSPPPPPEFSGSAGGSVRIRITDLTSGKAKINLVLPSRLVDSGIKLAKRIAPEHMLDAREIRRSIEEGYWGPLLDITDDSQRVEIIVEGATSPGLTINNRRGHGAEAE